MARVRSFVFNAFAFVFTVLMLLGLWVLLPFPRSFLQETVRFWAKGVWWALRTLVGLRFQVRGRRHVPDGAVILAAKHQSAWDTAVFYLLFKDPCYVLKRELLSIPFWGWYARKARAIGVDREGGARALRRMIADSLGALAAGRALVIFPEGTRTRPGERRPYHPGIAALYAKAASPVVPVAVNSGVFWGRRRFIKWPGTVTIEFLPPIEKGLSREAFMAELESRIETASLRLAAEAWAADPRLDPRLEKCQGV